MKSLLFSLAVILFNTFVENTAPEQRQTAPGWLSKKADQFWHSQSNSRYAEIVEVREKTRARLQDYKKKHQVNDEILEPPATESTIHSTYGELPQIYVDQDRGAIFPKPIIPPHRFSWFQTAILENEILSKLEHLNQEFLISHSNFDTFSAQWNELNSLFTELNQKLLYLSTWTPKIIAETTDLTQNKLKPHRVQQPAFLPVQIPRGIVIVPITTDIDDRKFISELEGAIHTHWNQSYWAKGAGIQFKIQWKKLKKNSLFMHHRETLLQHLAHFPKSSATLTTGDLSTHVRGTALILGPGRVTPRTLAHEFGHLLGFNDCYLRTLGEQGIFGLAVLEWDNPYYPDDLMCDNSDGEPRVEVW